MWSLWSKKDPKGHIVSLECSVPNCTDDGPTVVVEEETHLRGREWKGNDNMDHLKNYRWNSNF